MAPVRPWTGRDVKVRARVLTGAALSADRNMVALVDSKVVVEMESNKRGQRRMHAARRRRHSCAQRALGVGGSLRAGQTQPRPPRHLPPP
jgi:hypothetical protein